MTQAQRDEVLKVLLGSEAVEKADPEARRVLTDFALEDLDAIDKLFEKWWNDKEKALRNGLPSVADLDADAEEKRVIEATKDSSAPRAGECS